MLLPSAFSCDGGGQQLPRVKPARPKLPSFGAYEQPCSTQFRLNPLSSSCRALQTILGAPGALHDQPTNAPRELGDPFMLETARLNEQVPPVPLPERGPNKRRRSEFEHDYAPSEPMDSLMGGCSSTPRQVRTPKRRRKIPLSIPMGLSADDFLALEPVRNEEELDMPINSPRVSHSDQDSAYGSSPSAEDPQWTIDDDRMLVETVLAKLKLSKRDWNECARKLGKDRDSLGRRWSLLVGEGNVGLRRGGRISRTNLEISSW